MQLSVLSWSLLGCALFSVGPSLGVKRLPSSKEIQQLERDIEEVFSRTKEMGNDPTAKGEFVKQRDGNQNFRIGDTLQRVHKGLDSGYGININSVFGISEGTLNIKPEKRQLQQCGEANITCDVNYMYRMFNGSCNNLRDPQLGQAGSCHRRLSKAIYDDGVSAPKSRLLPNPRDVCIQVHRTPCPECFDFELSSYFMSYGQFVDHDLTLTRTATTANNQAIRCCPNSPTNNPECFPIPLGPQDPDFSGNCMNFTRSRVCEQCFVVERQQSNSLTPFIDCSHIYGNTEEEARTLRTNRDGKLKTVTISGVGPLPPPNPDQTQPLCGQCRCFKTGDTRSNQNLQLSVNHVVFLRFHNLVVEHLKSYNPNWGDEMLFQEARKFVIACFQRITFEEYLPPLVGDSVMAFFELRTRATLYNISKDPRTLNEAVTAAFRLHSTVPDFTLCLTEDGKENIIPMGSNFFNATDMCTGKLNCLAVGSFRQEQMIFDPFLLTSVNRDLYLRTTTAIPALDLCSINIQRGRDHGMPGYTNYLYYCFDIKINSFDELEECGYLSASCVNKYRTLYRNPHHIDLWSALQCEISDRYALVGKVGRCILGLQFHGTKFGDRFFWTHERQPWSLTTQQKNVVSTMTLERIMCDTLQLRTIPWSVFRYKSRLLSCNDYANIPKMDLSTWGK